MELFIDVGQACQTQNINCMYIELFTMQAALKNVSKEKN